MCAYRYICMPVHTHMCGGQHLPQSVPLYFSLRQGLSLNPEITDLPRLTGQPGALKNLSVRVPPPPPALPLLAFSLGTEDSNSGLQTCTTSILPTDPSSQLP